MRVKTFIVIKEKKFLLKIFKKKILLRINELFLSNVVSQLVEFLRFSKYDMGEGGGGVINGKKNRVVVNAIVSVRSSA